MVISPYDLAHDFWHAMVWKADSVGEVSRPNIDLAQGIGYRLPRAWRQVRPVNTGAGRCWRGFDTQERTGAPEGEEERFTAS